MNTNPESPVFPLVVDVIDSQWGLTKREYFAAMMMQAMLSNPTVSVNESNSTLARAAIQKADALIEHLNEDQDGKS